MRILFTVLLVSFFWGALAQEDGFVLYADSASRGMNCQDEPNIEREFALPGSVITLISRYFLNQSFELHLAPNYLQDPNTAAAQTAYTNAYEANTTPLSFSALATLFPESHLYDGRVRKLVAFADFENGLGSYEITLFGFQSSEGKSQTRVILKNLENGSCTDAHFFWMLRPEVRIADTSVQIQLNKNFAPQGALTAELIDFAGRVILVKQFAVFERTLEVPFSETTSDYTLIIKDAGNIVFARYMATGSF